MVPSEQGPNLELLSCNLEKLVGGDYSDAEIEVEGVSVGVHRCILTARSPFFHRLFNNGGRSSGQPRYLVSDLVPLTTVGYEAFMVVVNYFYTGKVKESPPEVSTCVDGSCPHDACGPLVNYAVEMMYVASAFQIEELVMILQSRLMSYVNRAFVEDVIPVLNAAFYSKTEQLRSHCVKRIARSDLDDTTIEKELPCEAADEVRSLRLQSERVEHSVNKIHLALDSDDVELVEMLLQESGLTLDAAYALHYAAAYCNPKIFDKVRRLGHSDINLKNRRGHTVLHVAARRKDPALIIRLLDLGASVSDTTRDGRTAVAIRRRLTRPKDYNESIKRGRETNRYRLCIDVLEREMCRSPLAGNVSTPSSTTADNLHIRLLLLENRVAMAMARCLFPLEARLAMQIAYADSTSMFVGFKGSHENEIPSEQIKKLQQRLKALIKTVETGRRFFTECSEVLDRLSEHDTLGDLLLEKGTQEEQRNKRTRFTAIMANLKEVFK